MQALSNYISKAKRDIGFIDALQCNIQSDNNHMLYTSSMLNNPWEPDCNSTDTWLHDDQHKKQLLEESGFTVVMTHSTKPKWCDYYMRFYTKHKVIWTISW